MSQDQSPVQYKTDKQVVDECNELALKFCHADGYRAPEGCRMHEPAVHPCARKAWDLAVIAYDHIAGTCVQSALAGYDDDARLANTAYGRDWCRARNVVPDAVIGPKSSVYAWSEHSLAAVLGGANVRDVMTRLIERRNGEKSGPRLSPTSKKVEYDTEDDAYAALGRVLKWMHDKADQLRKLTAPGVQ